MTKKERKKERKAIFVELDEAIGKEAGVVVYISGRRGSKRRNSTKVKARRHVHWRWMELI